MSARACLRMLWEETEWLNVQSQLPLLFSVLAEHVFPMRRKLLVEGKSFFLNIKRVLQEPTHLPESWALSLYLLWLSLQQWGLWLQDGFLYNHLWLQEALEDLVCLKNQEGAKTCQAAEILPCDKEIIVQQSHKSNLVNLTLFLRFHSGFFLSTATTKRPSSLLRHENPVQQPPSCLSSLFSQGCCSPPTSGCRQPDFYAVLQTHILHSLHYLLSFFFCLKACLPFSN